MVLFLETESKSGQLGITGNLILISIFLLRDLRALFYF